MGLGKKNKQKKKPNPKLQNPQPTPNYNSGNNLRRSSSSTRRRVNAVCYRRGTDFFFFPGREVEPGARLGTVTFESKISPPGRAWAAPRLAPARLSRCSAHPSGRAAARRGSTGEASAARSELGAIAVPSPRTAGLSSTASGRGLAPGGQPPPCPRALTVNPVKALVLELV